MKQQAGKQGKAGKPGTRKIYSEKKPTPKGAGRPQASLTAGYRAGKGTTSTSLQKLETNPMYMRGYKAGKKARGK